MIRSDEELFRWLRKRTKHDFFLQRILSTGRVESLGVFDPLPCSEGKGWIVQVTLDHYAHNNKYFLAVSMNIFGMPINVYQVSHVPLRHNNEHKKDEEGLSRGFDRIKRCADVYLAADRSAGDNERSETMDESRRNIPIVPAPVHDENM